MNAEVKITASEMRVLRALDAAPDKIADASELRRSANLTLRGFRTVAWRMEDRRLIGRSQNRNYTLTFAGMMALKEAAQVSA